MNFPPLLVTYLDAMLRENEHVNLTAIRDRDAALVLHVADSLAIEALALAPRDCLDLGTGNGFPGVALQVLFPAAKVTLLDRTQKKIAAIGRALAASGLDEVATLRLDAAQAPALAPSLRGRFDLVTARAVAGPNEVAALAAPLLGPHGRLCLWLDADTEAPQTLAPRFRRVALHEYVLQSPNVPPRTRRLALYALEPARFARGC